MELNPKEEKRFVKSDDIDVSFDSDFRRKTHDERWGESFQRLVDYKSVHGDCNVPYRCKEDPFLGRWVSLQRSIYKSEAARTTDPQMLSERVRRLNAVGFDWNPQDPRHAPWEQRYSELVEFAVKYGHARVPLGWKPPRFKDNVQLAHWVSAQRREYTLLKQGVPSRLTDDRLRKLNKINFVWKASRGKASSRNVGSSVECRELEADKVGKMGQNLGTDHFSRGEKPVSNSGSAFPNQRKGSTSTLRANTLEFVAAAHHWNEWDGRPPTEHQATIPASLFPPGAENVQFPQSAQLPQEAPNALAPEISSAQTRMFASPVHGATRHSNGPPLRESVYQGHWSDIQVLVSQNPSQQLDETSILGSYYRLLFNGMQQPTQSESSSPGVHGTASSLFSEQASNFPSSMQILSDPISSVPTHCNIQFDSLSQQDYQLNESLQSGSHNKNHSNGGH